MEPPEGSCLQQVSVGIHSVWAITRDHRVWFRRGLQATRGTSADNGKLGNGTGQKTTDTGTSWLLMVGLLNMVAVGPNDQVGKGEYLCFVSQLLWLEIQINQMIVNCICMY